MAGSLAYFLPAAKLAWDATGQVVTVPSPGPSPSPMLDTSPSPSAVAQVPGAFTVLLLGSDDDSKFSSDHVLTQSMILVRIIPSTHSVTMLSIPRDLYVPFWTGASGKIAGAYSYGQARCATGTVGRDFCVHMDYYLWILLMGLVQLSAAMARIA